MFNEVSRLPSSNEESLTQLRRAFHTTMTVWRATCSVFRGDAVLKRYVVHQGGRGHSFRAVVNDVMKEGG